MFISNRRRGPEIIDIIVGTNKWKSGGKHYKGEKFIRHEDHDNPRRSHDIALIRLQEPIEFNEKVQPIKISSKEVKAGENLKVTGWGYLRVSIFVVIEFLS